MGDGEGAGRGLFDDMSPEDAGKLRRQIQNLNDFDSGTLRACPVCEGTLEQITCWHGIDTRVLFVKPCGHRLGVWTDAPKWAREAGIVEDDTSFLDEAMRPPTCEELREIYPDEDWTGCED